MPERTMIARMKTDGRGWPVIRFSPENDALRAVALFLEEDVGVFLPPCDELLQAIQGVLGGQEEETSWNGDRFLWRIRRDLSGVTDLFGEAGVNSPEVLIETHLLGLIVEAWRDFVSELPRQQEFAGSGEPDSKAERRGGP